MVSRPVGEVPEAIRSIARPLNGDQDIDRLTDLVADKRIVMIGEATHGTHEFYEIRAALSRRLIEQHGFAAVAIEGDWPDALRVDRFVRDLSNDDVTVLASLDSFERFPRWMWRNDEVVSFITWLHGHNSLVGERQRAGFYGLDLYSLQASMRAVIQYLDDNDHEAAARARERYACFDHVQGDAHAYGLQAHLGIGPKCETEVVAQLVELQLRKLARSGRSPAGDAWFHAVQQAHVVRNAEQFYRMMFAGRSASWNLRDTHMADTLDMLATHLGDDDEPAKLIVWAHNSHVGDARATEQGDDGQISLGQVARQRHPGEVALIGFTTHDGSVIAADDWDEPPERMVVRPSLPGSWEQLFHDAGPERFYLTAGDMHHAIGVRAERLQRAIGVVYRPASERRSHYLRARLADEVDLVVHIDSTRGIAPLDTVEAGYTPAHEVPETFPTGV